MSKWKHRDVKKLVLGHIAGKRWSHPPTVSSRSHQNKERLNRWFLTGPVTLKSSGKEL